MPVTFPSRAYFEELRKLMEAEKERFQKLGFIDTTFAVRVTGGERLRETHTYLLTFHTFSCTEVQEMEAGESPLELLPADFLDTYGSTQEKIDFILEAPYEVWKEMLQNIKEKGRADGSHTLNTLTHLGTPIKVLYDDPDGHDRLFRYSESIQEFWNLSAKLDLEFADEAPVKLEMEFP